jgi:crotonobetainyl-CoA:carnitine CoA-transferase CaiB-like acyl-CoA transferase
MCRLYAHGAILAALLQRKETGSGQKIDCNLLSTQVMPFKKRLNTLQKCHLG